ncbi:hypothetical protein PIB30_090847 [Stylosanthes scabra]|uniref:Uncharacterized protein n=1 Tax=Stylosanthes scabra TaxID=79078 RepID=A0ABU6RUW2_9FABA|nr:hypothetical protein [Stylosanthes scabra]
MCDGGEEEKEIGGMKPTIDKKGTSEEDEEEEDPKEDPEEDEEEEDPKEEVPASTSLPMDVDADEDYLQVLEASVSDLPEDSLDRRSIVMALRVKIFPEYGHRHHRVRVFRVPRLVSTQEA